MFFISVLSQAGQDGNLQKEALHTHIEPAALRRGGSFTEKVSYKQNPNTNHASIISNSCCQEKVVVVVLSCLRKKGEHLV